MLGSSMSSGMDSSILLAPKRMCETNVDFTGVTRKETVADVKMLC